MEHQGQHGHGTSRVDEYGNQVAAHGAGGGQFQPAREEHKTGDILHRSGSSSSSSSSEDDGMGGRRKKGVKEKIKEKLPGAHRDNLKQGAATGGAYGQQGHAGMTGGTGAHGTEGTGEKKGLMDKIKEKLPGQH